MNKIKKVIVFIGISLVTISFFVALYLIKLHQEAQLPSSYNISRLTSTQGTHIQSLDYSAIHISNMSDVYKVSNQDKINQELEDLKSQKNYQWKNMLLVSNPYLTDTTGLYAYFNTKKAVEVSYTVETKGCPTFTEKLYNTNGTYSKNHSYHIIGAVGGRMNKITFTAKTKSGKTYEKTVFYRAPRLQSTKYNTYAKTKGSSKQSLSDGLFATIGDNGSDIKSVRSTIRATYLVDNNGTIRSEIPIVGYNSLRLTFTENNEMYLAISTTQIAKMNRYGRVLKVYNVGSDKYNLHHDYVLDDDGNILALATKTTAKASDGQKYDEDRIIKINTTSGEVSEVANFKNLFSDLYSKATGLEEHTYNSGNHDIVHLNTIQYVGDDSIIVSSRETSTILKINHISSNPTVEYMIGDRSIWKNIDNYSQLLYKKIGQFTSNLGQHSVTYQTDDSLPNGQYYLYMFDNNYEMMDSRTNFDWSSINKTTDGTIDKKSKYYKYLVDENTHTYTLVQSFTLPYSAYVGSAQVYGENNHIIIDSGYGGIFQEYDKNGKLITSFKTNNKGETFIYRTYKYSFNDFYFRK